MENTDDLTNLSYLNEPSGIKKKKEISLLLRDMD
jgi:hypothetical protein